MNQIEGEVLEFKYEEISDKVVMNDVANRVSIMPPDDFSFNECLVFLARSPNEILHTVREGSLYKLIKIDEKLIVIKVFQENDVIVIEFSNQSLDRSTKLAFSYYVWDLFDLGRDLKDFYKIGLKDKVLNQVITNHFGLRIIGIPDLFEALSWAIMGQQINLTFAFTLKRKFVEKYGESFSWNNEVYWLFPVPEVIAKLEVSDLMSLQFTKRKAEYVIGIAKLMSDGILSREQLLNLPSYEEKLKALVNIRGVGNWTADYTLMKCLMEPSAFPIADVGLHNALKTQLKLEKKPSIDEIKQLAKNWKGWEGYVTFYLWRSLYM